MMPFNAIRHASAGLACSLLLGTTPAIAGPFSALYVLGDSLSDSGRLFAMTGGNFPPAPYYQGRFSDGPVAVEALASGLGLGGAQVSNLAIAGAHTGLGGNADANIGQPTGMLTQLAGLQGALAGANADSNALYMVWGGANDMRGAFGAGNVGVGIATAIGNLTTIVSTLHGLGATRFLLPNLPDLGLTPEARSVGEIAPGLTFSSLASAASEAFNQQLSTAYGALAAQWSDEHFYFYDAMAGQRRITNGAPGNGFTNVTSACIGTAGCATALYFDSIHPTAAAHQILAGEMLAAVPEPQTMLLMALGLLGLLAVVRRRQA